MVEFGVEFHNPVTKDKTGKHDMPALIFTIQGEREQVMEAIELLSKEYEMIKCHERRDRYERNGKGLPEI